MCTMQHSRTLIFFNYTSHMTVTSPKPKWMSVADTVRRFYHLILWKGEFYFDVVGNFEPKKISPNYNALAKSIISYIYVSLFQFVFLDSVKLCCLQTKKHAVTPSERAHIITRYKQKRRRNKWASKQVSQRYLIA